MGRRRRRQVRHSPLSTRDAKEVTLGSAVRRERAVTLESVFPWRQVPCRSQLPPLQRGAAISWRLFSACFCGVAPRSELGQSGRCRIARARVIRKR